MNEKYKRQLTIIEPETLKMPILVIGGGGIGSWSALALAKMGCQDLKVMDFDKVELHNTASQIYDEGNIGKNKVKALAETIEKMTSLKIGGIAEKWSKDSQFWSPITISGVDSIETRKEIWEAIPKDNKVNFYIDGRMAGNLIRIYIVDFSKKEMVENYDKAINSKIEVEAQACTERAVVYNTFICGGLMANIVKKAVKNEELPKEIIFDLANLELMRSYL